MAHVSTNIKPQLLKVSEAARLLSVSTSTIHNWIKDETVPYIKLPAAPGRRADYRLPLAGLIGSLSANYDLTEGLDELVAAARQADVNADVVISAAGDEPEQLFDDGQ